MKNEANKSLMLEQLGEAWDPCEICRTLSDEIMCKCSKYTAHDQSITTRYISAKFCPECGRPLTGAAWKELERRVKGEKDGKL